LKNAQAAQPPQTSENTCSTSSAAMWDKRFRLSPARETLQMPDRRLMPSNFLVFALAITLHAAAPCPMPLDIQTGTSLPDLATKYFGGPRYAISIALATNERTGDGFRYISNPDDLSSVPRVCIPFKSEARQLQRSWQIYERAVAAARLPRMAETGKSLLTIPPDQPVYVVAWVRKDQADRLKINSGEWVKTAPSEIWVTIEPHLQAFCRAFMRDRKPDENKLTQRLEQRLGLSPASNKTYFVRMHLAHPGPDVIFRPCVDPAVDQANCSVGPPAKAPPTHQQWFYQQYYSSYGQSMISEFPWTALGYTFDWAAAKSSPFQRTGESEFVVYKGAPIDIQEVIPTAQYCTTPAP
jgi:hypothetical protein